jgi:hypothetical protein
MSDIEMDHLKWVNYVFMLLHTIAYIKYFSLKWIKILKLSAQPSKSVTHTDEELLI